MRKRKGIGVMQSLKTRLSRDEVLPTALKLVDELAEDCMDIVLAGSLRRKRPDVGDIEIVAIPILPADLFGDADPAATTRLDRRLRKLAAEHRVSIHQFGPKAKRLSIVLPCKIRVGVDLYTTDAERWPITLAIRTGPADYAKAFVTPRDRGGLLRNGCRVSECRLWCEGQAVALRDERHFFEEFVAGGFWPPEDRRV